MNSRAPSTAFEPLQLASDAVRQSVHRIASGYAKIIAFLDAERGQLPVWSVVAFGSGVAAWFLLPGQYFWIAFIALCLSAAFCLMFLTKGWQGLDLAGRVLVVGALMAASGSGLAWVRSELVAPVTLAKPFYGPVAGQIIEREDIPARGIVRLILRLPEKEDFPEIIRVNLSQKMDNEALKSGAIISAEVRLMPPAQSALPGAYNFARRAWFEGLGASGTILKPPQIIRQSTKTVYFQQFRADLSRHIQQQMAGSAGAIAATLATGDRGAIAEADAEAMRRSGLAHLLSISGLHVSAIVAASWLLFMRVFALFPVLARRHRLPLSAALFSAATGLGYTLLTGAEVPTIRACIAAMMVLLALAMGRDPISLRLVAFGAFFVLLIWPEALMGPSFQLSFAAVTVIIALHDHPKMRSWLGNSDTSWWRRVRNGIIALFLTGLAIEFTLMPIALFHFHKAGLYGAFANLIAIPLTTFVIMPLEALALLLDIVGLGAPAWWACGLALNGLIGLAHSVSGAPGAVTFFPSMGNVVFALFIFGGLWMFLWRSRLRYWGLLPVIGASLAIVLQSGPDLLVTSDGRHMAIRSGDDFVMLRDQAGDYALDMLKENSGFDGEPLKMAQWTPATCSEEFCSFTIRSQGTAFHILASRNKAYVPRRALYAACRRADIVISDRYLPRVCMPRQLKADRALLHQTGGLAIYLEERKILSVADENRGHPWFDRTMVRD